MIQFDFCKNFSTSYNGIYTIESEFCAHFKWSLTMIIKGHAHAHMASNANQITSADLFFFFHPQKVLQ